MEYIYICPNCRSVYGYSEDKSIPCAACGANTASSGMDSKEWYKMSVSERKAAAESIEAPIVIPEQNKPFKVIQVTLKEKFIGTGSRNVSELEDVINDQAGKGYILHSMSTTISQSVGIGGGDRIQATLVFKRDYEV